MPRLVALLAVLALVATAVSFSPLSAPAGAQPLATTRALLGLEEPELTTTPTGQGDADETAVPLGPGVDLLYYRLVQDEYDNIRLFGEVRNTGAEAIPSPRMQFTLYDDEGNVVGSLGASAVVPVVSPSETAPIEGFLNDARVRDVAAEEVYLCETFGGASEDPSAGLEIRDVEEESRGERQLSVEGIVFNTSDSPIDNVSVLALVYDADGRYAGSARNLLQFEIPPGRSGPFSVSGSSYSFAGLDEEDDDFTYDIWVGLIPSVTTYRC